MLFSANIGFMTVTSIMELPVWTQFYEKQSKHPISNVCILSRVITVVLHSPMNFSVYNPAYSLR